MMVNLTINIRRNFMKPFASDEWVEQHHWKTIQQTIEKLLAGVVVDGRYFDLTYLISGEKSGR
jgi:hypothetical protein